MDVDLYDAADKVEAQLERFQVEVHGISCLACG
jgi:hypothetical protein